MGTDISPKGVQFQEAKNIFINQDPISKPEETPSVVNKDEEIKILITQGKETDLTFKVKESGKCVEISSPGELTKDTKRNLRSKIKMKTSLETVFVSRNDYRFNNILGIN